MYLTDLKIIYNSIKHADPQAFGWTLKQHRNEEKEEADQLFISHS